MNLWWESVVECARFLWVVKNEWEWWVLLAKRGERV